LIFSHFRQLFALWARHAFTFRQCTRHARWYVSCPFLLLSLLLLVIIYLFINFFIYIFVYLVWFNLFI
jgi:hypothetical protein